MSSLVTDPPGTPVTPCIIRRGEERKKKGEVLHLFRCYTHTHTRTKRKAHTRTHTGTDIHAHKETDTGRSNRHADRHQDTHTHTHSRRNHRCRGHLSNPKGVEVHMWARTCSLMLSHRQVCKQQLYSLSTKLTTKSQSILVDLRRCTTTSLNKCLNSRLVSATASTTNVTNILFAIILTSKHSAVSGLHNLASNELQMENIDFTPATWTCHAWFVPTQIPKPKSDVNVNCLSLRTTHSYRNQILKHTSWTSRTFLMIHNVDEV